MNTVNTDSRLIFYYVYVYMSGGYQKISSESVYQKHSGLFITIQSIHGIVYSGNHKFIVRKISGRK